MVEKMIGLICVILFILVGGACEARSVIYNRENVKCICLKNI